jgi:geranylgeranyl pyrophosphate synthase
VSAALSVVDPAARLKEYQARVERALEVRLPSAEEIPVRLHSAMRYSALGGGKRVRPALVYATGEIFDVPAATLDAAAAAVEMIHVYSLIHDDLPAMDDDDLRRGRPTCHRQFDEATAILAGDALQVLAFQSLAADGVAADRRVAMIALLADASGTRGMAGGQAIDLAAVGRRLTLDEVDEMHRRKTGALLQASVLLGALASDRFDDAVRERLSRFGARLGLAFQIVDDILDIEGDPALLGKTVGADIAHNKPTYPAVIGIDAARARARRLHDEALAELEPFGERGAMLRWLADYIVGRSY